MSEKLTTGVVSVLIAILGVAMIALLVSNKANTGNILGAGSGAFSKALCTVLSPITGGNCGGGIPNVSSTISFM